MATASEDSGMASCLILLWVCNQSAHPGGGKAADGCPGPEGGSRGPGCCHPLQGQPPVAGGPPRGRHLLTFPLLPSSAIIWGPSLWGDVLGSSPALPPGAHLTVFSRLPFLPYDTGRRNSSWVSYLPLGAAVLRVRRDRICGKFTTMAGEDKYLCPWTWCRA